MVLYIGAEFCPYCAAERWPMVVALSHFGKFRNLKQTHSALGEGDISTFSFYGSGFSSPYLEFVPVETTTDVPAGNHYQPLQKVPPAYQALWRRDEPGVPSLPFVDIGGRWLVEASQYQPSVLAGRSFSAIARSVGANTTKIGRTVDAAAAVLVKYICSVTGQEPTDVCRAVAGVRLPAAPGSRAPAGASSRAG